MHRHPAWVAVVWTEADAAGMVVKSLAFKPDTVPVQFFGTHEVGRLKQSQVRLARGRGGVLGGMGALP